MGVARPQLPVASYQSLKIMRVIFLQDVSKIGRKFDVKDVADGYARNFLLPRKCAVLATPDAEKRLAAERARSEASRALAGELLAQNIRALEGVKIELTARVNVRGHLFASVGQEEIATAIAAARRVEIPPELIQLEKPIKEVGEHALAARSGETIAHFVLSVKPLEQKKGT
ncbi:MAG: 50S ribosomal protein L9 [bacterium]|nr:50S ribosomal protein L9 [bacterium]MDZ4285265.1 50S ribosomal protein L9 [Patescibacteria group bacterium]